MHCTRSVSIKRVHTYECLWQLHPLPGDPKSIQPEAQYYSALVFSGSERDACVVLLNVWIGPAFGFYDHCTTHILILWPPPAARPSMAARRWSRDTSFITLLVQAQICTCTNPPNFLRAFVAHGIQVMINTSKDYISTCSCREFIFECSRSWIFVEFTDLSRATHIGIVEQYRCVVEPNTQSHLPWMHFVPRAHNDFTTFCALRGS